MFMKVFVHIDLLVEQIIQPVCLNTLTRFWEMGVDIS